MTEYLPARVETWFCEACERAWPSELAASRCAQLDDLETD